MVQRLKMAEVGAVVTLVVALQLLPVVVMATLHQQAPHKAMMVAMEEQRLTLEERAVVEHLPLVLIRVVVPEMVPLVAREPLHQSPDHL